MAAVAMLLSYWGASGVNPWASRIDVNKALRIASGAHASELDLALMKRYVDCARVLGAVRIMFGLCG